MQPLSSKHTMRHPDVEQLFSGLIGAEYDMLTLICPAAPELSKKVGALAGSWQPPYPADAPLRCLEIGCGTGITTLALLLGRPDLHVLAVDNEATMLSQAARNLSEWQTAGRLEFQEMDVLSALKRLPEASLDLIASNYAVHNFRQGYRVDVLAQVFRVLKPGALFINGDRYAVDDVQEHLRLTQDDVRHWFKAFTQIGRMDLLEQWVIHLFSDESPDHIMYLTPALEQMRQIGFEPIEILHRDGVNTLLTATKPL